MAKKRAGWEYQVFYGTAGSTAATQITANLEDVDPGVGDWDYAEVHTRGDGTTVPEEDSVPVLRKYKPKFSMIYKDGDANMAALLAAADTNPPTAKAFVFKRYSGGSAILDKDFYIKYSSPGPLKDGQKVEFELTKTSEAGR